MGIKIRGKLAAERFQDALGLARSGAALPDEWIARAGKVGESPSKTFVAMLGTALLARATDGRIDPLALQTGTSDRGYSARGLCTQVLVPCSVRAGLSLGTNRREPLNNHPFYSQPRVGLHLNVKDATRPHLATLCEALAAIDTLTEIE